MFDATSDHALNKMDRDAIVYKSAAGAPVRLTRRDFSSEAEFLYWKVLSDEDYHKTEKADHIFHDHTISLDDRMDGIGAVSSPEMEFLTALDAAEASVERFREVADMIAQVRSCITEIQYRRLWMYCVDHMTVTEIARSENVSKASVSRSIRGAQKNIFRFFSEKGKK